MKKTTLVTGLALALVLPAGALAKPQPDTADRRAAKAECNTLRGSSAATREAFLTRYRNFGACVRAKAAEEAREEKTALRNASQECKEERAENEELFLTTYGTGPRKRNAHGKCVSQKAKQNEAEADQRDRQEATALKNAATECAAERDETLGAQVFGTTYGTEDANYTNAFGKCVSEKARENDTEQSTGA
jgi:hypothetical protein